MKRTKIILTLMLVLSTTLSAQSHQSSHGTQPSAFSPQPSDRMAKYREAIGLDYSMPDYSTSKIDAKVMGPRLANLLQFYEEVYNQNVYSRWIDTILGEQNEAFEHSYVEVKKQKLVKAYKTGNEITIIYKLWLDDNPANIKYTEILYHFKDGVSESDAVNEMFSQMSHYVNARVQLNK